MKLMFGLLTAIATYAFTFAAVANASEIFVRDARGQLSQRQRVEVTGLVKNAVKTMSEHELVNSASQADYVLQPSVVQRGDELVLRVEKQKNGEILAMSEQTINSVDASKNRAVAVTETVLADSNDSAAMATDDDGSKGTSSAATSSADDADSRDTNSRDADSDSTSTAPARNSDTRSAGAIDVTGNAANAATAPATRTDDSSTSQTAGATTTPKSSGADASVGELTSASPRMLDPNRIGQIQLGAGPSFAINMKDDSLLYDLMAAYAVDFSDNWVGKAFGDFNFATGSSVTHFINLGLGGEYYPTKELLTFGKPYLVGDVGYAFARDALSRTGDGISAGVGAGFKFQAAQINWDVAANYTLLLERVADETPSVFGVRVALGF